MSEENLDCRGLACPNPVLRTKEIIDRGNVARLSILVDNAAARENVSRFLSRVGYEVSISGEEGNFRVTGTKEEAAACEVMEEPGTLKPESRIAVLVGTDSMGKGDETLGRKLIINFIATLKEMGPELWRLILLNGGVKLTVEGSECLAALMALEKDGVHVLVCGTCLNYFGLLEKKLVGETTNMLDIVTAMQLADKVISVM
ncbi:MAG: sulfurtransferase-like selenium metabolism protein YedF [Syntrophobacteraceae bacterium]|jgi:selenium metabolism protein YedF